MTEAATSAQPSPLAALIEARNFSVTFGANRLVALKGMNLTVHAGEIVVLVGPSGCGKTTFLNSVCGLLPPSAQLSGTLTVTPEGAARLHATEGRAAAVADGDGQRRGRS